MIRWLVTLLLFTMSISANAAEMRLVSGSADGIEYISVVGDFEIGDDQKFISIALPLERAIVAFNSNGGNLSAGLKIGMAIRLKEFTTLVPANSVCASACGLAWLGGSQRLLDATAKVGFHAAYIQNNGESRETGMGNALAGAYLNQLGLTQSAIAYLTEMGPQDIKWLTPEDAKNIGIEMTVLASTETRPAVVRPESNLSLQFPKTEPQSQNLKRVASADIFGFDLPNMPLNDMTLEACELACKSISECKAYTFKPRSAACYLKSNGAMVVGNPLADTGYKVEIEASLRTSQLTLYERTNLQGGDYQNFSGMSLEQCIRSCEYGRQCASFTYIQRSKSCWVKSSVPAAISNKAAISGVKASR